MNFPSYNRFNAHTCISLSRVMYNSLDRWRIAKKPAEDSGSKALIPDLTEIKGVAGHSPLIFRESWATRRIPGPRNRYEQVRVQTPGALIIQLQDGTVFIAHRGTKTRKEWDVDTNIAPVNFESNGANYGKVHYGFNRSYFSYETRLKSALRSLLDKTRITATSVIITGHSLGAAISTLNTRAFNPVNWGLSDNLPYGAITFASPQPGQSSFKEKFPAADRRLQHVINEHDLVPKLPGLFDFCHVGNIHTISEDFGGAGANHALKNYGTWVDRLFNA